MTGMISVHASCLDRPPIRESQCLAAPRDRTRLQDRLAEQASAPVPVHDHSKATVV
jgi:hypothetical protein